MPEAKYHLLDAAVSEDGTAFVAVATTDGARTFVHINLPAGYVVCERMHDIKLSEEINSFLIECYKEGATNAVSR